MKRILAFVFAAILLLSLAACAAAEEPAASAPAVADEPAAQLTEAPTEAPTEVPAEEPTAAPTEEPAPQPGQLAVPYVQILQSGAHYFQLTVQTASATQTVTSAARDGMYLISIGIPGDAVNVLVREGMGYMSRPLTGEVQQFNPAEGAVSIPVYSTLAFRDFTEAEGRVTEAYTCKMQDGSEGTVLFVFENGTLVEMTTPELSVEGTWPVAAFSAEPPAALFDLPGAGGVTGSPYAWLGYAELPQCRYFDIMATGCYYREYDVYALGYVLHRKQASDINNLYENDGANGVSLILNGMTYVLNEQTKTYLQRDASSTWEQTLATQKNNREQGVNATGRQFVTKGSGPVPLLSDNGDAAVYEYYEFLIDQSAGQVLTQRDRVYFKDGDVYAIHTLVTSGDQQTETTEVITAVSGTPDPALFALPADFSQYTPVG